MSRKCKFTGKKPLVGNKVSHAKNKTKTRQAPNIKTKRLYYPEEERWVKVRISARALRTISKKGLQKFLDDNGLEIDDVLA